MHFVLDRDVVIVGAARTPIGGRDGILKGYSATDLGSIAIRAALERAGISPADVGEVILGNVVAAGLGMGPAKKASVGAGIPQNVPASAVNSVCSSGMSAVWSGVSSIVLGVVEGDVHDIGKNLVKMMFEVAGWTVYDLGKDVPLDKFVEEQLRTDSEVVGLSALMTTSMLAMPVVIEKLRAKNPKVRILLGGAPVNPEVAKKYGADGYAKTAGTAVDEAINLLKMLKEEELGK